VRQPLLPFGDDAVTPAGQQPTRLLREPR